MPYQSWCFFGLLLLLAMADTDGKTLSNERRRRNYQKLKRINEEKALTEIRKRKFKEEWSSLSTNRNKSARHRLRKAKLLANEV